MNSKITNPSEQGEIMANKGIYGLGKGDNPLTFNRNIVVMYELFNKEKQIQRKYGLHTGGYGILLRLIHSWVINHTGLTIYALANGDRRVITATSINVNGLLDKGLIEVFGTGHKNSRLFVPTKQVMGDFAEMFSISADATM